ncbi:hypothetical protein LXL04_035796 [Taraxacum kok-saghyz]
MHISRKVHRYLGAVCLASDSDSDSDHGLGLSPTSPIKRLGPRTESDIRGNICRKSLRFFWADRVRGKRSDRVRGLTSHARYQTLGPRTESVNMYQVRRIKSGEKHMRQWMDLMENRVQLESMSLKSVQHQPSRTRTKAATPKGDSSKQQKRHKTPTKKKLDENTPPINQGQPKPSSNTLGEQQQAAETTQKHPQRTRWTKIPLPSKQGQPNPPSPKGAPKGSKRKNHSHQTETASKTNILRGTSSQATPPNPQKRTNRTKSSIYSLKIDISKSNPQ